MTDLTIPDEAVQAAGAAIYETFKDMRFHPVTTPARAALEAALPILHPTIPNTVEALDTLPDGAILRAELGSGAITATREGDEWGTAGNGWLHTSDELARYYSRITAWTVLWPLGGAA